MTIIANIEIIMQRVIHSNDPCLSGKVSAVSWVAILQLSERERERMPASIR